VSHDYQNGAYAATNYEYVWSDAGGKPVFTICGVHESHDRTPPPGDAFHFAVAAEAAWSEHVLAAAREQLQREGSIVFSVDEHRSLRVGCRFIEFHFRGAPERIVTEDIATLTLDHGRFSFRQKDARWWASDDKFKFDYSGIANAKAFAMAVDRLVFSQSPPPPKKGSAAQVRITRRPVVARGFVSPPSFAKMAGCAAV